MMALGEEAGEDIRLVSDIRKSVSAKCVFGNREYVRDLRLYRRGLRCIEDL